MVPATKPRARRRTKAVPMDYPPQRATLTADSGWIPLNAPWNYWQTAIPGHMPEDACAAVESAISAYAQTAAMLSLHHWRSRRDGGRDKLSSALSRVMRDPNDYQTRSDFVMNQVRTLYYRGNAYALAVRGEDGAPDELHPLPDRAHPRIDPVSREIFYDFSGFDVTPLPPGDWVDRTVPARYVWHLKLNTPRHPLVGVTPLESAVLSAAANASMSAQQQAFFANMSRPSGTLNTDMVLTTKQVAELRERWQEQSTGLRLGGVPILTAGLKWSPMSLNASDTQLIEYFKLTVGDIARALRIPGVMIGINDGTQSYSNAEALMAFWLSTGLGFLLNHVELSLDKFFGLPEGQYCEFDTSDLLRSAFKDRIDALVRGVQGGVFAPNEARATESLPAVEAGDMPRVQQQLVALDWEPPEPAPPSALPAPAADDEQPDEEPEPPVPSKAEVIDLARAFAQRKQGHG
jgi:HK97 family phage portal protein